MTENAAPTNPPTGPPPARRARIVLLGLLLLVAGIGALLLRDHLTFAALQANRDAMIAFRDQHYPASVAAFMATYAVLVALSLPGATIATLAGGFLFGLFPGALYNVTAATLGACVLFVAARWGLADLVAARVARAGGAAARIRDGLRDNEIPVLLLMRLVPAMPFFVANLIPAMLGVSLGRFAATTFVGIIPGGVVITWVGAGLAEVFANGAAPDLGILFTPRVLAPLLALCALAALPIVVKRLQRGRR